MLLFKPSVSCFSEMQLLFSDTKYVLYFCSDRRLCVLCFLGGVLSAFAQLLDLLRTTVDFILDFVTRLVPDDSIFSLTGSQIAAVAVDSLFFSGQ